MKNAKTGSPHSSLKIGIAGGGLLGRLSAWQLALMGHNVTLFDSATFERPAGACWVAAGMISPLSEVVHCPSAIYEMGMESLNIWPQWIQMLEQQHQRNMHFRQAGSLVVAHAQDQAELNQFCADLTHKLGTENSNLLVRQCKRPDIAELEPALDHFSNALHLIPEADLNNRRILHSLLQSLKELGVNLVANTSVHCEPNKIVSDNKTQRFDWVIDTRGLGAKSDRNHLRGVRGEVLVVETNEITLNRPVRLMHPRYKLYVVPKPNQQFVIGATEIESEDMTPMSLQSNLELSSALYTLNPAFAEARIIEQNVHCRPAFLDNLPKVQAQPGLIEANGLYRHGYLLSPVIVQKVLVHIDPSFTAIKTHNKQVA